MIKDTRDTLSLHTLVEQELELELPTHQLP